MSTSRLTRSGRLSDDHEYRCTGPCRDTPNRRQPASGSLGRGRVADEHVRQFRRAAERYAVASGDLVGSDGETLGDDPAHEVRWEEAILGAQHEPRRYGRPRVEWPRALPGGVRLVASPAQRLLGKGARHVVVEGDERVVAA